MSPERDRMALGCAARYLGMTRNGLLYHIHKGRVEAEWWTDARGRRRPLNVYDDSFWRFAIETGRLLPTVIRYQRGLVNMMRAFAEPKMVNIDHLRALREQESILADLEAGRPVRAWAKGVQGARERSLFRAE